MKIILLPSQLLNYWEEEEEEEGRRSHLHVSHIDVDPYRAAETSKLGCFKWMPASLRLERELRRCLSGTSSQGIWVGRLHCQQHLLSSTHTRFVLRQEGRFGVSSKRKDEAMEG